MLATLSPGIVEGPEWVFEEKYDGIRAVAGRERGQVKIWSRTLQDLTGGFPHVVAAVEALGDGDLMIDGELVASTRRVSRAFSSCNGAAPPERHRRATRSSISSRRT